MLGFRTTYSADGYSGLILVNSGLGPARIIKSQLTYDGVQFEEFNESNVNKFRRDLQPHQLPAYPAADLLKCCPLIRGTWR